MRVLFTALFVMFVSGCDTPTPDSVENEKPVSGLTDHPGDQSAC